MLNYNIIYKINYIKSIMNVNINSSSLIHSNQLFLFNHFINSIIHIINQKNILYMDHLSLKLLLFYTILNSNLEYYFHHSDLSSIHQN